MMNHHTFPMTAGQYDIIYNFTSFTLASMMATTMFLWLRLPSITEKYKSALAISGLVTFIAFYHYVRIFNSWVEAYEWPAPDAANGGALGDPVPTGIPFNDAYRYMDWLLTVPMLLIEIVLVMKLSPEEASKQCKSLGLFSALMIIYGYPGELILDAESMGIRFIFWFLAMHPFLYIVYALTVGLRGATMSESDPVLRSLVSKACWWTVISWCTYPVVYVLPMLGVSGSNAVVGIQIGYCIADVISKCGVGLIIYQITNKKSQMEAAALK